MLCTTILEDVCRRYRVCVRGDRYLGWEMLNDGMSNFAVGKRVRWSDARMKMEEEGLTVSVCMTEGPEPYML